MKRIMFIGKSGCGKTTMTQALRGLEIVYQKTQHVKHVGNIIDTPGEFITNRRFYSALTVSSNKCDVIGMVHDGTVHRSIFPPKFSSMFGKKVIGVVTKTELEDCDPVKARKFLKQAGAKKIFEVSSMTEGGLSELITYLNQEEY